MPAPLARVAQEALRPPGQSSVQTLGLGSRMELRVRRTLHLTSCPGPHPLPPHLRTRHRHHKAERAQTAAAPHRAPRRASTSTISETDLQGRARHTRISQASLGTHHTTATTRSTTTMTPLQAASPSRSPSSTSTMHSSQSRASSGTWTTLTRDRERRPRCGWATSRAGWTRATL